MNAEQRNRSGFTSTLALVLAIVAVVGGVGIPVVQRIGNSDECGTGTNLVLNIAIVAALLASVLALIVGSVAVARRSDHVVRDGVATAVGVAVGALVLIGVANGLSICSNSAA